MVVFTIAPTCEAGICSYRSFRTLFLDLFWEARYSAAVSREKLNDVICDEVFIQITSGHYPRKPIQTSLVVGLTPSVDALGTALRTRRATTLQAMEENDVSVNLIVKP
jgi:hypothetical protein